MWRPSSVKLYYFPLKGRGLPCRIALIHAGIEFEDIRLSFEEFKKNNPSPTKCMPVLDIDGKLLTETAAIIDYAAAIGNFKPSDPLEAARVAEVYGLLSDCGKTLGESIKATSEKKLELRKKWLTEEAPKYFGYMEVLLTNNGNNGHFAGRKLTGADIFAYSQIAWIVSGVLDHIPTDILKDYPRMQKMMETIEEEPSVKKALEREEAAKNK